MKIYCNGSRQKYGEQLRDYCNTSIVMEDGTLDQSAGNEGDEMWLDSG